jgi:hypothetical protein
MSAQLQVQLKSASNGGELPDGRAEPELAADAARVDEPMVHAFMTLLHDHAVRALDCAHKPGVMQLVTIHHAGGAPVPTRFAMGDGAAERMAQAAIDSARAGHNVYVETRTVAETLRARPGKG